MGWECVGTGGGARKDSHSPNSLCPSHSAPSGSDGTDALLDASYRALDANTGALCESKNIRGVWGEGGKGGLE